MRSGTVVATLAVVAIASRAGAFMKCTGLTPAQCCAARKITAVATAAGAQAGCYSKVANNLSGNVDPACVAKARANLVKAFVFAESAGGCATVGDANAINTQVIDVFGVRTAAEFPPTPAPPTCDCGVPGLSQFGIFPQPASGTCGTVHDTNNVTTNLDCANAYFGGGANAGVLSSVSAGAQYASVAGCTGSRLELGPTTAAQVGSRSCTSAGCFYGSTFIAGPLCIVATVRYDLSGTADCRTGEVNFAEPIRYDGYPAPCPLCTGGVCDSGPSAGLPCTADYPGGASVDCLPDPLTLVGTSLNFDFVNTTGTQTRAPLATGQSQANTFCGFCRNPGDGTFENPAHQCVLDGECTNGVYTACQQYTGGAFGNPLADSITMTGTLAGDLTDGLQHNGTIVSAFCVGPSNNQSVNTTGDIPSPAAASVFAKFQLLP